MTREEAIKLLNKPDENINYDEKWGVYFTNDWLAAYEMAISALREQEERSKGCKYCTATYIQHGSLVGFCPYCGRRLEEI